MIPIPNLILIREALSRDIHPPHVVVSTGVARQLAVNYLHFVYEYISNRNTHTLFSLENYNSMIYKPFPYFIYRAPLLPINELDITLSNKEKVTKRLQKDQLKEAVFLGSPALSSEINKIVDGTDKDLKEENRILLSCVRYISRMSTRCTPFGLFAGCGIGTIGDETNIIVDDGIGRTTRLDMSYLSSLYHTLIKIPEVRSKIRYFPNNSLYKAGRNYRYVETIYRSSGRKYQIAEIKYSIFLDKTLKSIQHGADIETIASILIADEISRQDALDFIDELITSNIIVPELNEPVTGDDLLTRIISLLEKAGRGSILLTQLKSINILLKRLDTEDNSKGLYKQVMNLIKEMKFPFEEKFLFQVDMFKKDTFSMLGSGIIDEIHSTLTLLNKITPSGRNETLHQFQRDFYDRYEEREVSLMKALDPDIGIGYPSGNNTSVPSPLIDDWVFPQQRLEGFSKFQSILLQKMMLSIDQEMTEIELTDKDIERTKENWEDLPSTICVMIEIIKADSQDLLIKWNSCGGSSAANLLSRFAHLDKRLHQHVKAIADKEQEIMSNVILAEIVHSPEARTGNILSRPHLRDYEIPYLSGTDLPYDKIINLTDLLLSIRNNKLVIRCKKQNKEIVPRLTTAHNYHHSGTMPVYRFLCDMQSQTGRSGLNFNWKQQFGKELPFMPRVRYRKTILFPATWVINCEEIKSLFTIKEDKRLIESVSKWRSIYSIPSKVLMPDYDNELFVNWENPLSVRSLFSIIKKRQTVKFTEFLFESENAVIKNKDRSEVYTNEFIVAFHKS